MLFTRLGNFFPYILFCSIFCFYWDFSSICMILSQLLGCFLFFFCSVSLCVPQIFSKFTHKVFCGSHLLKSPFSTFSHSAVSFHSYFLHSNPCMNNSGMSLQHVLAGVCNMQIWGFLLYSPFLSRISVTSLIFQPSDDSKPIL